VEAIRVFLESGDVFTEHRESTKSERGGRRGLAGTSWAGQGNSLAVDAHGAGVEGGGATLAEEVSHDRAEEVGGQIFTSLRWPGRAPDTRGGKISHKTSAVGITKLKESAIAQGGENEGGIASFLTCWKTVQHRSRKR
jgi:hypothetical protein